MSDELAIKMGPVYFSRLVNLHRARLAALRNIVLRPPAPHTPTANCDHDSQRELSHTSTSSLQAAFLQAGTSINCPECQNMLHQRIQEVTNEWLAVKVRRHAPPHIPPVVSLSFHGRRALSDSADIMRLSRRLGGLRCVDAPYPPRMACAYTDAFLHSSPHLARPVLDMFAPS
ncbi:hypothetical protein NUW54_g13376 [Trametes sanguinea]|uniref:Uncharacterized protein n=1 Tax=Trametes sanguinea TaxID=158606 RepID=A0ACC1MNM9_9APHY|nr:hypothetical protein NUW54_g13376 [Trametes sanguinea]